MAMCCGEENEMIKLCGKICKFLYFHMIYSVQNATRRIHTAKEPENYPANHTARVRHTLTIFNQNFWC